MKKILLSCVTCLLAVGLLAGCDDEVEEPEDPNAGVVEPSGDDGGTGGGESGGTETTYKLGVLNENLYSYYYFDGSISNDRFGGGSADWDKGVSLSVETTELGTTLSWEESGTTYYLGYGLNSEDKTCVTKTTEVSYVALNEEHDSIEDPSGQYFLGAYSNFTTLSWNAVSYYDSDFVAHLYTSAQTNPTKPGSGDEEDTTTPFFEVEELENGESYYLGFPYTSSGETSWYMFDGTTDNYGDYLQCKVFGTEDFEPVEVKVSITEADPTDDDAVDTIGLTFTLGETEYTIYAWPSSNTGGSTQYGEITFIATSLLNAEEGGPNTGAVTEFAWDESHGTLAVTLTNGDWYFSTYQDKSSISLTSTSKTYAASHFYTANPKYVEPEPEPVPEVVEPDLDNDETYKLGVLDTNNAVYRYFNGTTHESNGTFLVTTTVWNEAVEVYITAQPNYTEENSCTLSTVIEDELKYISFDDSSTSVTLSDTPCVVVYDSTYDVFAVGHNLNTSGADRMLCLYTNNSDIRAYQGSSSSINGGYDLVKAYSTEPSLPAVESITVSGATTVEVGSTITLVATIEPKGASTEVTWSSDNEKATVDATTGEVTGVAATTGEEVVTITATSTYTNGVSGSINITVIEAQKDPDNLIGTFDFSTTEFAAKQNTDGVSDSATLLTDLKLAYTGNGNDLSSVTNISNVYCGGDKSNGTTDVQKSAECLKLGKGSYGTGSVSITFSDASISIAKVVIVWCPYSASNLALVVNGETQTYATAASSYSTWDAVTETVYDSITETGYVLSLASAKGSTTGSNYGALIHSIKLYSAEA